MKNLLTKTALTFALALTAYAPAAIAKPAPKKTKPSAAHVEAVKKCNDDYKAAQTSARTLKGKERSAALARAKAARRQCMADAPK